MANNLSDKMQALIDEYNHLEYLVQKLYSMDSFWEKCRICVNNGKCCKGATILISDLEWTLIENCIKLLPKHDYKLLKNNTIKDMRCPFWSRDKCLIHDTRPANCRYTPYQAVIDSNNLLSYSSSDCKCNFIRHEIECAGNLKANDEYIFLPCNGVVRPYIFINSYADKFPPLSKYQSAIIRLRNYFDQT